jgi:hypothetical protein
VIVQEASSGIDYGALLGVAFDGIKPFLPMLIPVILLIIILAFPLPGRGPGMQRRDPWRGFRFEARRVVLTLAGKRCEAPLLLAWGRCGKPAEEVDHIYPWSKGGATVVSNGQALCKLHNRSKSNFTPPWWYVLSLERRRRKYYPVGANFRVSAAMSTADKAARAEWATRKKGSA